VSQASGYSAPPPRRFTITQSPLLLAVTPLLPEGASCRTSPPSTRQAWYGGGRPAGCRGPPPEV